VSAPPTGYCTNCTVVRIIDGDTVEVEIVKRVPVRLLDCWSPELRTKDQQEKLLGLAAKARLTELAKGKSATLFVPTSEAGNINDIDTMGRVLGRLWIEGETESLSEMQVKAKHASTKKGRTLGT
jgi:endonuclease YncB( thermonuclease family)